MSYPSDNVAYGRWQPDRQSGRRGDYYYGDNGVSGNNVTSRDHASTGQWQNEPNQQGGDYRNSGQPDMEQNQYGYRGDSWSGNNPERSNYDYREREPSHRYPQTFQADQNQRPKRSSQEKPYGSENENINSNRNSSYYSERDSYSRPNWPDNNESERFSPQHQQRQKHDNQYRGGNYTSSYNTDPQANTRQNFPGQSTYHESSLERYRPTEPNGYGYRQDRGGSHQRPPNHDESGQGSRRENTYNEPGNEYSKQNQDFQQYDRPVYHHERPHEQTNQKNQYREDYGSRPHQPDMMQKSSDPPRVAANKPPGGPSLGKSDYSPTHYHGSRQAPPPRGQQHQLVKSPVTDFPPSFDQYRGNDSSRQSNQQREPPHSTHQYRNALTPISEKASPTSSIRSKGHLQDNMSNLPPPQSLRNQYDRNMQSWDSQGKSNFQNQRKPDSERESYGQPQRPQVHQERSPAHFARPGYRDFDASSGYASESTHNTEISPNESRQQPNKSPYNPQFPAAPLEPQNWAHSSNDGYNQSMSPNLESQNNLYDRNPPVLQGFNRGNQDDGTRRCGEDTYGPPVSLQGNRYNDKFQHSDNYGPQGYHKEHAPYQQEYPKNVRNETQRPYHPPQKSSTNQGSGVEENHVPSVQVARNMFEKRSDPRLPPPAPKPIVAPKPSNVNARPIPPRPSAIPASPGWEERGNQSHFQGGLFSGPKSPTSPQGFGRQPFSPNSRPIHSQSMENLDDRSRYIRPPPSRGPPHTQSFQNLNERSAPPRESNISEHGQLPLSNQPQQYHDNYPQNEYQRPNVSDDRPLVVAVKFNQESGVSLLAAKEPPKRRGSWSTARPDMEPPPPEPSYREQRQSWSDNVDRGWRNREDQNWPNYPSRHRDVTDEKEDRNYVPDVVARSYEMAMAQSQAPQTDNIQANDSNQYSNHNAPRRQDHDYDNTGQRAQNFRNGQDRQSTDRWPTPPPPISQNPSRPQPRFDNLARMQPRSEDWQRKGLQQHAQPNQSYGNQQRQHNEGNPPNNSHNEVSQQQRHPPPPTYNYDSESSEIDVDAPTPPPTQNRKPTTSFDMPQGHSSYDRNKPVPVHVTTEQSDSWRIVGEQPPNSNRQRSTKQSQQYPVANEQLKNPPQKPQRNSTGLSPRVSVSENRDFDFDINVTQPLRNQSSREKVRLGKSGALANRKPPSRHGSASNLTEITDEDNFQIEVTDSDLSSTNNKMEVHRMESMRILQTEKEKRGKETAPDARPANSDKRPRSSQKSASNSSAEAKPESKKPESKLYFKKPAGDAAKTIPMPAITEPANDSSKRPPTYLGFGHTPEKPKTDLLSQFKSARDSAMRTAADKQNKAMKSVTAMVKFKEGKKEVKKAPRPKLTSAEKNAMVLSKMNVEVTAPPDHDDDRSRNPYHRHRDDDVKNDRKSTRLSSTVNHEKYDGDGVTTNGSRLERDKHGRGRDRHRTDDKVKSRGRSTSRDRNLSPDRRRGRSSSRGRNLSPDRQRARSRHRSKSRDRSLSPDDRHRSRPYYEDRRYDDRYRRDDESSYRRSNSPDRLRYDDRRYERMPEHHRHYHPERGAREPDWVEQFRRGRDVGRSSGHQVRRAWVNDPRRVEVTVDGRRRELDMDAFEREVKKATSYNSDFEQPQRRQMIPSKLSAKGPPNSKRKPPPNNWMNDLKERNRMAATARFGRVPRY